ncbi:2-C-methyl-D-erythritol 4-phosphate cytidylyltransferase [Exiguobacterium qingdaonense]|uniref:2-C-methyl-D-erythritol 4-phosphate cytidylyltransferase n=1 Tax=Exiguobacterium qingdaonense TaxID=2751251 RepID=UPI001BE94C5F|nr:2-C-methyl-D-erythritol 4-phosphate cytidylyltransferase [Exiguobacterium qingdaonense]
MVSYTVVIPAAGRGKRMGADENKLMLSLRGKPIVTWTLEVFDTDPWCERMILSIRPEERDWFEAMTAHMKTSVTYVSGGEERQQSVYEGLKVVAHDTIVMIHDGARPFVTHEQLHRVAEAALHGGAILAVPVKDTVKQVEHHHIERTVPREKLWLAQTPQAFQAQAILNAHERAAEQKIMGTDDASLFEWLGESVQVVLGDYHNIKMTTPEDLLFGDAILAKEDLQ